MALPSISLVMPTIGWDDTFRRCAEAALAGLRAGDQALIVFDGTPPPAPDWLRASAATLLSTGHRQGPAAARNLAAAKANGEVLLFVDADVQLHPDAVARIRAHFAADPGLTALFGSYDATPAAPGLVSRFRNLLHHHTHTSHPGPATTFWAGCGAVRRQAFHSVGGFDPATFPKPSIEDIDLGLRLSDAGCRILLDPAIQGTHHKRWTLASMLTTDIRQRAIPWSQLLLGRRQSNTSLNLDRTGRASGLLSLLAALSALALPRLPSLWPLPLLALAGIVVLNRDFYQLCFARGGTGLALAAIPLHGLYFLYSTLCYGLVLVSQAPRAAGSAWPWRRALAFAALAALLGFALLSLAHGLHRSQTNPLADLLLRAREFAVFQNGAYPIAALVPPPRPKPFPTSVYPPYAQVMFAAFFAPGGLGQAWPMVHGLSLLSLALMAWIGWRSLRFFGPAAGLLGAIAPLAIGGNSNALFHGQFSILCMGWISLQWLLLERKQPLAAGLCWAAAMLKPQIAISFALPFLRAGNRRGLALAISLLLLLSGLALLHTRLAPLRYIAYWLQPGRMRFVGAGSVNAMGVLGPALGIALAVAVLAAVAAAGWLARSDPRPATGAPSGHRWLGEGDPDPAPSLRLQGLCAVLGTVAFYHINYDNIMLYPALLAIAVQALALRSWWSRLMAVAMAVALWLPVHLTADNRVAQSVNAAVWTLVGLTLLLHRPGAWAASQLQHPLRPSGSH